jgi:hypothetical protein
MLTPTPDVAAVLWKRMQLRAVRYRYTDVKPERLQRAIDADVDGLRLTHRANQSQRHVKPKKRRSRTNEAPAPIAPEAKPAKGLRHTPEG